MFELEGIIYIAILMISIAFALTVGYIALVLHRVSKTLRTMGNTLGEVGQEMQQVTPQLTHMLQETNGMMDDIEEKMKATDSVFATVENMGNSINTINHVLMKNNSKLTDAEMEQKTKPYIEGIRWAETAFYLFDKWKRHTPTQNKQEEAADVSNNHSGREG